MKNNKGYVLLELIFTFSFISIILINIWNISFHLSKIMIDIYKKNNINTKINLLSNDLGYDLYNNTSVDCYNKKINDKQLYISGDVLHYGTKKYGGDNIKFNNITCNDVFGYYQFIIEYNQSEEIDLYSLKKVD